MHLGSGRGIQNLPLSRQNPSASEEGGARGLGARVCAVGTHRLALGLSTLGLHSKAPVNTEKSLVLSYSRAGKTPDVS